MRHVKLLLFMSLQQCFEEVERQFDEALGREHRMNRDDWAHGSLLVVNELLRCSNVEGEVGPGKRLGRIVGGWEVSNCQSPGTVCGHFNLFCEMGRTSQNPV